MTKWRLSHKFTLRRSLALRTLSLAGVLIIIPLLIHSLLTYRADSQFRKRSLFFLLKAIGDGKVQTIQKEINDRYKELQLVGEIAPLTLAPLKDRSHYSLIYWSSNKEATTSSIGFTGDRMLLKQPIPGKGLLVGEFPVDSLLKPLYAESIPVHFSLFSKNNASQEDFSTTLFLNENNFDRDWSTFPKLAMRFSVEKDTLVLIVETSLEALKQMPQDLPFFNKIAILFWLIVGLGGISVALLTYYMGRPFNHLLQTMEALGKGNLKARYHPFTLGFECNTLGHHFNHMVDALLSHMHKVEGLSTELRIGREVQRTLLPKIIPQENFLEIGHYFFSAQEVGGDFYDFFSRGNEYFFLIADVSGKGIHACLYSFILRSLFRSLAFSSQDLSQIVREMNNLFLLDTEESGMFATAWIGKINRKTDALFFASAGHFPALLKRANGEVQTLKTEDIAMGALFLEEVQTATLALQTGDLLLLFTDGLIEVQNVTGEWFGLPRLIHFIQTINLPTAQDYVNAIIKETATFQEGTKGSDDIAIFALRIL
jgi:serine phosphatase RsbU (regulator of sigma subunit)